MENYHTPDLHDPTVEQYIPTVIHESDQAGTPQWGNVSLSNAPDWVVRQIIDRKIEESTLN